MLLGLVGAVSACGVGHIFCDVPVSQSVLGSDKFADASVGFVHQEDSVLVCDLKVRLNTVHRKDIGDALGVAPHWLGEPREIFNHVRSGRSGAAVNCD